jgi:hypothetical protein
MNDSIDPHVIFTIEIEQLMIEKDLSLMDAAIFWCESRGLEVEYAASMIKKNKSMKARLRAEGEGLRMVKREEA